MAIDFDHFVRWCENRFDKVVVRGDQVKIPSIFAEDRRTHLWCNPKMYNYGVYHCWKSDASGTLVSLVMQVDKCNFGHALDVLGGIDVSLLDVEAQVDALFCTPVVAAPKENKLELPPDTYLIAELISHNKYRMAVEEYLANRKIPTTGLMVCVSSDFQNEFRERIIIPYYNREGDLIYFNGRYIGTNDKVGKYKGPDKEFCGIGKDDVLFVPEWPAVGETIYLTEGEFDAISLTLSGFKAGAFGGKNLSPKQIEILREYCTVLCLDSDKAGRDALPKMGEKLLGSGIANIQYVMPPKPFKDWNEMYVKVGSDAVYNHISQFKKPYGVFDKISLLLSNL